MSFGKSGMAIARLAAVPALLLGAALDFTAPPAVGAPAAAAPAPVANASAPAVVPPVSADAPVRALLIPDRETTLAASMSGRLTGLEPRPGERVRKGQVIARFECGEAQARREMAVAELESARLAHDGKIRLQGLESVSELEVELAAAVTKARAQVGVANAQLAQCRVVAPFSGWVAKWHAKPFQGVNAGAPLLDIVSDTPPRVRVNVPSLWLSWLKAGGRFDIDVEETGRRYAVQVKQINSRVDPVSQTVVVEAQLLGKDPDLLPGMSGPAVFPKPK
ncbi:MAG TPA: efflux RND transporter periplasmic adaptor subunit [Accumulibacter sp.]|jgi:RND family efflux transporter MFP subunit|nr:efflux RND transporter periplasmic adaptor subunit [Accumulibacter sp.]HQC81034.1 efflux RND transporter periplasmic adaptor subunit [Accumulibacter sp.]